MDTLNVFPQLLYRDTLFIAFSTSNSFIWSSVYLQRNKMFILCVTPKLTAVLNPVVIFVTLELYFNLPFHYNPTLELNLIPQIGQINQSFGRNCPFYQPLIPRWLLSLLWPTVVLELTFEDSCEKESCLCRLQTPAFPGDSSDQDPFST